MKTIKFEKEMSWEETAWWIRDNENKLYSNESEIMFDMSGVNQIRSNLFGFFIDIFRYYNNNGIMFKIIPPKDPIVANIFHEIGVI
jgi:hypothetical protein